MMPVVCSIDKDGTYRSGNLILVSKPIERVLVQLFYRFEADRLLDIIFHESAATPTLRWFLTEYLDPERSTLIGYKVTDKPETHAFEVDGKFYTPLGMVWINRSWKIGASYCKAECGMAFVRRTPVEDTLTIGRMSIAWGFDNLAIDSLIGCTPSPNRAAVMFGHRLGFVQTTPLEGYSCWRGKLCSVVLQSMTRDRWCAIPAESMKEAA